MKLSTNVLFQSIAIGVGVLTQFTPLLPPKHQGFAMGAAGLATIGAQAIQAIAALKAHTSDTKGNPLPQAVAPVVMEADAPASASTSASARYTR
jgi:nitrate/nitrite transporter NarK